MNALSYNHLIFHLQSNNTVGKALADPAVSDFDIKKAITQGPPLVRLKLLKYCLETSRYNFCVSAFFEKEASQSNFGKTSVNWIDGFPKYSGIVMGHVLNHLQPIHYKDFIVGCAQRTNEKEFNETAYNHALLYDIFRLTHWPANTVSLVLDCVKNMNLNWKSVVAVRVAHHAMTQNDQNLVFNFVKNLPSLHFGELYGLRGIYDFATLTHKSLLQGFLGKLCLEEFKELLADLPQHWEPKQYQIFAEQIPNTLSFKQAFFQKMNIFYERKYIDDHMHANIQGWWLEANIPTTSTTSSKRKM